MRPIDADEIRWTATSLGDPVVFKTTIDQMPTITGNKTIDGEDDISSSIYDTVERHDNCTVEVMINSVTGEQSIGWWENDNPPLSI